MYAQDAPLAERRAQALTLDRGLLAELLGQTELRELIDPEVVAELESELQQLSDGYRVRDADELHDCLRRLGDLSEAEIQARCTVSPDPWLAQLSAQHRAARVVMNNELRWIAAEDAGLFRDALGVACRPGLPKNLLAPVEGL